MWSEEILEVQDMEEEQFCKATETLDKPGFSQQLGTKGGAQVFITIISGSKEEEDALNLPKQVLLKLQPTRVAVGSPFTIECRVPSVAPLEGLTVTLLRSTEVLHSQTFEGTALSPQEAMVTYSAEAQLEDSSHNFSCQAKMDLRSRGVKVVDSVSDSQALEVFEPVQDNWMVIIVVVSVLLFLVTSVLLCFVFGQQGNHRRRGIHEVQAAWMRLRGTHPAQPA
ncbi:Intercellular adhesion molecule 2 [Camelus dromedarius]|uniref:Intercellular adhesion molecule 2 n=1 Tax=Camelus dromedarius TaxID=9838 RepID=A0A5N4D3X7_CAMDR|nr:Intercellular adhesion molecule 2 [Camelus dromedarius]